MAECRGCKTLTRIRFGVGCGSGLEEEVKPKLKDA